MVSLEGNGDGCRLHVLPPAGTRIFDFIGVFVERILQNVDSSLRVLNMQRPKETGEPFVFTIPKITADVYGRIKSELLKGGYQLLPEQTASGSRSASAAKLNEVIPL